MEFNCSFIWLIIFLFSHLAIILRFIVYLLMLMGSWLLTENYGHNLIAETVYEKKQLSTKSMEKGERYSWT